MTDMHNNVEWRTLVYQGKIYEKFKVANSGHIKNVATGTIYKEFVNKNGYCQVAVSLGSRKNIKTFKVHKAVAETFISNPENKPAVNHKDGNKLNNNVENLEWMTGSENSQHAYQSGLAKAKIGTDNYFAKLTAEDVRYIRKYYTPRSKEYGSRALGRKFGVDHMQILRIVKDRSYANVV